MAILEAQQDMCHILWFNEDNLDSDIQAWKFRVHVWGINSSHFIATFAIRKIVALRKHIADPVTLLSIVMNMYVDDLLKNVDTVEEAKLIIEQMTRLFTKT